MRFYTHDRTPRPKTKKSLKILFGFMTGLFLGTFLFMAVVCSLEINSIQPAVIILTPTILLTVLIIFDFRIFPIQKFCLHLQCVSVVKELVKGLLHILFSETKTINICLKFCIHLKVNNFLQTTLNNNNHLKYKHSDK